MNLQSRLHADDKQAERLRRRVPAVQPRTRGPEVIELPGKYILTHRWRTEDVATTQKIVF